MVSASHSLDRIVVSADDGNAVSEARSVLDTVTGLFLSLDTLDSSGER